MRLPRRRPKGLRWACYNRTDPMSSTYARNVAKSLPRRWDADYIAHILSKRVEVSAPPESRLDTPCWIWQGVIATQTGYGRVHYNHNDAYIHRVSFTLFKGKIPDGWEIDHRCRVRSCWNPAHLRCRTKSANASDIRPKGSRQLCDAAPAPF